VIADRIRSLDKRNIAETWFRTVISGHAHEGVFTSHTKNLPSRFSAGNRSRPQYEILYLSESPDVSLAETRFHHGILTRPRTSTAPQPELFVVIPVEVELTDVADLTHPEQADLINTNAQELTGDWRAYSKRVKPDGCTSLTHTETSPTQQIGQALFDCGEYKGFITFSAVEPAHANLVIFPERLTGTGSRIKYAYTDHHGNQNQMQIP